MNKKKNFFQKIWQVLEDTFATSVIHGEANGEGFLADDQDTSDDSGSDIDEGGCECE